MNNTYARFLASALLAVAPLILKGAATIVIVNGDPAGVGFNDPTVVTPVGGNSGTTLGEQRRIAFQAAADKWGAALTSSSIIRVNAVWTALFCTANGAVIGSAGPSEIWRDFPGAAVSGRWYPKALADRQSNSDLDPSSEDIIANFNVNLGKPDCLAGSPFYLGLDNHAGGKVDLVAVLEHEFAHGLGFHTATNRRTGDFVDGIPSIADDFLTDTSMGKNWTSMSAAERAASAVNNGRLVWTGGNVTYALPRVLQQNGTGLAGADSLSRALLYAPKEYDSGSSVVHWDRSASPNQLMEPEYSDDLTHEVAPPVDLTLSMLQDIGWSSGAAQLPQLQLTTNHTGDFKQGQSGAQTILVANSGNAPTVGMVSTLLSLPAGLTATSITGTGWNCSLGTAVCSRSDALAASSAYPPITAALKVASSAPTQVSSVLGAWGGGSLPAAATDSIAITVNAGGGPITPAEAGAQKILPQLAFGGGWYTALYFTNTTNSAISFAVNFIGDSGTPLTVPAVGNSSTTVNLTARGTAVIEAANIGDLKQGYVSLFLPTGVTGYGIFHQNVPGVGVQEAVVPLSGAASTVSTLVWDETDFVTAVAIVNPSSAATTVAVTVRDTTGTVIGTSSVNLPANNKVAVALRNLTGLSGMVGKRGSAEFTVGSGAVAVLGLRFSGSAFTSIPTMDR